MTTDNRTNGQLSGNTGQFTEAQVEAAAKALRADEGFMEEVHSALEVSWSEYIARLVLVAAQGDAPQAESADCDRDRMGICKRCGMGWDARKVLDGDFACPVLPSSTESPVEPFKTWFACWWKNEPNAITESNAQSAFYAGWDARGLPSSGLDEEKLAEVIAHAGTNWEYEWAEHKAGNAPDPAPNADYIARAVAEWLKGQGR